MNAPQTMNLTAAVLAMDEAFTLSRSMDLSERTKEGENKKIGEIQVFYPSLEAFGIEAEHDLEAEAKREPSNPLPIYKDSRFDWLMSAVQSKVEAQARSKTLKGKLKEGATIPTTFAELVAVGERGGEWLKIKSEAVKSYQAYLANVAKKSQAVVTALGSLFANPNSLHVCEQKYRDATMMHVEKWASLLSSEEQSRFEKPISMVSEAIEIGKQGLDVS